MTGVTLVTISVSIFYIIFKADMPTTNETLTAFISIHPCRFSCKLVDKMENASKCIQTEFFKTQVPQKYILKYLGMDRRLAWKQHSYLKITQIKLKMTNLDYLSGISTSFKLLYKVMLYNNVIKPIWAYGIKLWGTDSASNINKLRRRWTTIFLGTYETQTCTRTSTFISLKRKLRNFAESK